MAVLFVLLAVIAQAAFLVVARETAAAAVAGAARSAARPGADMGEEAAHLLDDISRTVPGAIDPSASIEAADGLVRAEASFIWRPPGPDLTTFTVRVGAVSPVIVPP